MNNDYYDLDHDDFDDPVTYYDNDTGEPYVINPGGYKVYLNE